MVVCAVRALHRTDLAVACWPTRALTISLQGLPFAIAGVGDLLALFRCVSCRYRFAADASRPALMGAIGRVFSSWEVRPAPYAPPHAISSAPALPLPMPSRPVCVKKQPCVLLSILCVLCVLCVLRAGRGNSAASADRWPCTVRRCPPPTSHHLSRRCRTTSSHMTSRCTCGSARHSAVACTRRSSCPCLTACSRRGAPHQPVLLLLRRPLLHWLATVATGSARPPPSLCLNWFKRTETWPFPPSLLR